jgi:hypothetical protein
MIRFAWGPKYILGGALLVCIVFTSYASQAETPTVDAEFKLTPCGHVFLAQMKVNGTDRTLVIDSGSTTMMNDRTFPDVLSLSNSQGYLTTFLGKRPVPVRVLTINEFQFGGRKLRNITLPAVDLSMTKLLCGKELDGVFGTDLLAKLNVRIDFAAGIAIVPAPIQDVVRESKSELHEWEEAFNHGDAAYFRIIFSSDIVWLDPGCRLDGREAVIAYLQREYFERQAHMKIGRIDVSRSTEDASSYQISWEYKVNVGTRWSDDRAATIVHHREKQWEILSVNEWTKKSRPAVEECHVGDIRQVN